MGVMWSCLGVNVIKRAEEFWIVWRGAMDVIGKPNKSEIILINVRRDKSMDKFLSQWAVEEFTNFTNFPQSKWCRFADLLDLVALGRWNFCAGKTHPNSRAVRCTWPLWFFIWQRICQFLQVSLYKPTRKKLGEFFHKIKCDDIHFPGNPQLEIRGLYDTMTFSREWNIRQTINKLYVVNLLQYLAKIEKEMQNLGGSLSLKIIYVRQNKR